MIVDGDEGHGYVVHGSFVVVVVLDLMVFGVVVLADAVMGFHVFVEFLFVTFLLVANRAFEFRLDPALESQMAIQREPSHVSPAAIQTGMFAIFTRGINHRFIFIVPIVLATFFFDFQAFVVIELLIVLPAQMYHEVFLALQLFPANRAFELGLATALVFQMFVEPVLSFVNFAAIVATIDSFLGLVGTTLG